MATLSRSFASVLAPLLLSACLSVDMVPQRDQHDAEDAGNHPAPPDDASMPKDASMPDLDASTAQMPDAHAPDPIPCIPAGTTVKVAGASFASAVPTCEDASRACVEGECVPIPSCAADVKCTCRIAPEGTAGKIVAVAAAGDYVYWLEEGTFDALQNYNGDATLARARIGEWKREVIATGFSGAGRTLALRDSMAFVTAGAQGGRYIVSSLVPGALLRPDPLPVGANAFCITGGQQYWGSGGKLYSRSLAAGSDLAVYDGRGEGVPTFNTCVALGQKLYTLDHRSTAYSITEIDIANPTNHRDITTSESVGTLLGTHADTMIGVSGNYVSTIRLADGTVTHVASSQGGFGSNISARHVAWGVFESGPMFAIEFMAVLRIDLDGQGVQRVEYLGRFKLPGPAGLFNATAGVVANVAAGVSYYIPTPTP